MNNYYAWWEKRILIEAWEAPSFLTKWYLLGGSLKRFFYCNLQKMLVYQESY